VTTTMSGPDAQREGQRVWHATHQACKFTPSSRTCPFFDGGVCVLGELFPSRRYVRGETKMWPPSASIVGRSPLNGVDP